MEFKCKMCGSDLSPENGAKVAVCEVCGTEQTLPQADTPKKVNLFNKANALRLQKRFDEAAKLYGQMLENYPEESEAYWCLLLCQFGIEYVDDNKTKSKIPTCNRTLKTSIFDKEEYKKAIALATKEEKALYEKEAKEIDRLQKKILSISEKEAPYDIFICFKDTDEDGKRTKDSQLATKIYDNLTGKGYRVFFSRVTLKSKVGSEYEPLIYAALQSAKVMLVIGTKVEYMNAVWVRNEWSRYLGFMEEGQDKTIVPCIKDMDAYDLPEELLDFQAQDMGEMDFVENLTRAIDSKFGKASYMPVSPSVSAKSTPKETTDIPVSIEPTVTALLKRAAIFLEDKEWDMADRYCEKALDIDPENAEAYLYKAMLDFKMSLRDEIKYKWLDFKSNRNAIKAIRYAGVALKEEFSAFESYIIEQGIAEKEEQYLALQNIEKKVCAARNWDSIIERYDKARYYIELIEKEYQEVIDGYANLLEYKDSNRRREACLNKLAQEKRKIEEVKISIEKENDSLLERQTELFADMDAKEWAEMASRYERCIGYEDALRRSQQCRAIVEELNRKWAKEEEDINYIEERIRQAKEKQRQKGKRVSDEEDEDAYIEAKIKSARNLQEEAKIRAEIEEAKRQLAKEEYRKKGVCQHCGGSFKGIFTKICIDCGARKDY